MRSWFRRFRQALHARRPVRERAHLALETLEDRHLLDAGGYVQTALAASVPGLAANQDKDLLNPWGFSETPDGRFRISANGAGNAPLLTAQGVELGQAVALPPPLGSPPGTTTTPNGQVVNTTSDFVISRDGRTAPANTIFSTEDGTLIAYNPAVDRREGILVADQSATGAVYKLLGAGSVGGANFLYATDFHNNKIDVFDKNFHKVPLGTGGFGTFTDPNEIPGFAPFGVKNIGGTLFVTYAKQLPPDNHDDQEGPGNGFIDEFDTSGHFIERFATGGALNSPIGMTVAPAGFGRFGGDLLVGNFGDSRVSAFDLKTGRFLGQLTDPQGAPLVLNGGFQETNPKGLWGIAFGNGQGGAGADTLFFATGINEENDGLFGKVDFVPAPQHQPAPVFVQTNLVSDIPGMAQITNANSVNAWGLTAGPTSPFWVANQGTGTSTLYNTSDPQTQVVPLVVNIPPNPSDNPLPAHGSPTGDVFNTDAGGFVVSEGGKSGSSVFLFATTDGNIDGWSPGVDRTHALIGGTHPGAVYTGLAIGTGPNGDTLLFAADFAHNAIDVYNSSFQPVTGLKGNFTDPRLPAGYRVFNVQAINNQLYVEYAPFDPATGGVLPGAGNGLVDVFNTDGQLLRQLIRGGRLDDPWGIALAPANFGAFSNDLLVGNFGSGNINAFDPITGRFVGELKTGTGQPFQVQHLWALEFGNGSAAGPSNTLFFTAGLTSHFGAGTTTPHGLFGSLQIVPTRPERAALVPNLGQLPQQIVPTVPANGDLNPYGVAFVPQGFEGGGVLKPGDLLVSNFNSSANVQGTGSTIVRITPDGQHSVFFQGGPGLGLTTALGVLKSGFVIVGNVPTDASGVAQQGSLLILDANGKLVSTLSDSALLNGPWDLALNDQGDHAQVFVANVLSGTVTRIDLTIPKGGTPQVESETQMASGYAHRTDPNALVVGPTGLAFDPRTGTLYVASTADNAIFAIPDADDTRRDHGTGRLIYSDPAHLHGPLGLVLAPNGDLIVANGDAVNTDPNHANELVEITPQGHLVGEFQLDSGPGGAAFGLAVTDDNGVLRFAAVDDNTNTVHIWTMQEATPPHGRG